MLGNGGISGDMTWAPDPDSQAHWQGPLPGLYHCRAFPSLEHTLQALHLYIPGPVHWSLWPQ